MGAGVLTRAKSIVKHPSLWVPPQALPRIYGVVIGNCQAQPLTTILNALQGQIRFLQVPAVHLIRSSEVGKLHRLLERAAVCALQPISNNYRQMPLGEEQLSDHLPRSAAVVRFPSLYYSGLHPYQCYVRGQNGMNIGAPLVGYHDLRALFAASRTSEMIEALNMVETVENKAKIAEAARQSIALLRDRESSLDVAISDCIDQSDGTTFYTMNHPSDYLLLATAKRILAHLEVPATKRWQSSETPLLGALRAPVESSVARALELVTEHDDTWHVDGRTYSRDEVMIGYMRWLFQNPDVVQVGVERHLSAAEELGI